MKRKKLPYTDTRQNVRQESYSTADIYSRYDLYIYIYIYI